MCPKCGGKVTKNGTYWVRIQRRRCQDCGYEIISPERARQAKARRAQVNRLVSLSRFKLGLSVRRIQTLVKFVYARPVSIGHIDRLTQRVGRRAEAALARLGECRQGMARFLLYDETYPKMKKRVYSLLTWLTHLRDRVHLIRQIVRLFNDAVRDVTLDVPKRLSMKERRKQRQLKRRLLRKRLWPMLILVFKAFSPGYESVCVLMLEGVLSQLRDPAYIIQTASIQKLARRLHRFINKHSGAINTLLELSVEQNTPTTTNALESKNGIFKPFSRIAKFFPSLQRCQSLFAGVALMSKREVPIKAPTLCSEPRSTWMTFAVDFFSTVGLPEPQISLACITD